MTATTTTATTTDRFTDSVPHWANYVLMSDAAEYLGVSRQAVHKMIRTGRLGDGVRTVGDIRPTFLIPREALEAELARRRVRPEDLPEDLFADETADADASDVSVGSGTSAG